MKTLEDIKKDGWESGINQVWNADCLEAMKLIPDKSIDLVLTDPPYGINVGKPVTRERERERERVQVGGAKPFGKGGNTRIIQPKKL